MKEILGIDFGTSSTDLVVIKGDRITLAHSFDSASLDFHRLAAIIEKQRPMDISVTGGRKADEFTKVLKKRGWSGKARVHRVDEMTAIAHGCRKLTHLKRFLAVSVGTGTPFVYVNGRLHRHVGGTGIGGGTLSGLGMLLAHSNIAGLETMARKGTRALDATVGEVVGGPLDGIPAHATASNFSKATHDTPRTTDAALSVFYLIGESIGVMAGLAAKSERCKTVVFTGRTVAKSRLLRKILRETLALHRKQAVFPARAEYSTALGAAISGS